jgi:hypothetical protein
MSYNYNKAVILLPILVSNTVSANMDSTYLSLGEKLSNLAMMSMLNKKE